MTKQKFPNGVKAALDRLGIEQAEFARAIGENRQQVGRWVHGERKLTYAVALKMAPVLMVTPESLFTPPDVAEIIKVSDLGGHTSATQKDRMAREAVLSGLRNLSAESLAEVAAEAVSELQARATQLAQSAQKTKRTPQNSSPKPDS